MLARRTITRLAAATVGILACVAYAPKASALIVEGMTSMPRPDQGWVGNFNGSSGVCIAPDWVISAKHVGGSVGSWFILRDEAYQVVEARPHPTMDIAIYKVHRTFPGYHSLATTAALGDPCILGGFGLTAAAALPAGGYDWGGSRKEMWGANTIEMEGFLWGIRLDPPSDNAAVAYESCYALNDSGGGLFVVGADGSLQLAGIAVSVTNYGSAPYGTMGFCVNVITIRNWILPIVDPDSPIDSSIIAPQAMLNTTSPASSSDHSTALAGLGVIALSQRRRCDIA